MDEKKYVVYIAISRYSSRKPTSDSPRKFVHASSSVNPTFDFIPNKEQIAPLLAKAEKEYLGYAEEEYPAKDGWEHQVFATHRGTYLKPEDWVD